MTNHNSFGTIRQRLSGRWQARYMRNGVMFHAPATFDTCAAAEAWLDQIRDEQPPLHPGCPTCICAYAK